MFSHYLVITMMCWIASLNEVCAGEIFDGSVQNPVVKCMFSRKTGLSWNVRLKKAVKHEQYNFTVDICVQSKPGDCSFNSTSLNYISRKTVRTVQSCSILTISKIINCPFLSIDDIRGGVPYPSSYGLRLAALKNGEVVDSSNFYYTPFLCSIVSCEGFDFDPIVMTPPIQNGKTYALSWLIPRNSIDIRTTQMVTYKQAGHHNESSNLCKKEDTILTCSESACNCNIPVLTSNVAGLDPCKTYDICVINKPSSCDATLRGITCINNVSVEVLVEQRVHNLECSFSHSEEEIVMSWVDDSTDGHLSIRYEYGFVSTIKGGSKSLYQNVTLQKTLNLSKKDLAGFVIKDLLSLSATVKRCLPCGNKCGLSSYKQCSLLMPASSPRSTSSLSSTHVTVIIVFAVVIVIIFFVIGVVVKRKKNPGMQLIQEQDDLVERRHGSLNSQHHYSEPQYVPASYDSMPQTSLDQGIPSDPDYSESQATRM